MMVSFSKLSNFKFFSKKDNTKNEHAKRIEDLLVVERLRLKGRELQGEIDRVEKQRIHELESTIVDLQNKNQLLLEKANEISLKIAKITSQK